MVLLQAGSAKELYTTKIPNPNQLKSLCSLRYQLPHYFSVIVNVTGQKFAMLEMKSVISEILRKFVLLPNTKTEDLDFTVDIVLRTAVPVYVSFAKRPDSF